MILMQVSVCISVWIWPYNQYLQSYMLTYTTNEEKYPHIENFLEYYKKNDKQTSYICISITQIFLWML